MFNIVPQPNEIIITGGKTCFTLTPDTTMSKAPYIDEFRDFVKKQFDIRIHRDNENTENAILLKRTDEIMNDEGYRLVCRDGSVPQERFFLFLEKRTFFQWWVEGRQRKG